MILKKHVVSILALLLAYIAMIEYFAKITYWLVLNVFNLLLASANQAEIQEAVQNSFAQKFKFI